MGRNKKYVGAEVKMDKELVYAIWVNNVSDNDYVYVGSGFGERVQGNINKCKRGKHDNKMLQNAFDESATKEIRAEVLEFNLDSAEEARQIEDEYIEHFKKIDGVIVCNSAKAGASCTRESYNKYEKLTEDKVREIKQLLTDCSNKELAETYNCSENTISKIRTGYRWASVTI